MWITFLLVCLLISAAQGRALTEDSGDGDDGGLETNFYKESCPSFQSIVAQRLQAATAADSGQPASLTRLFFHDAFVQGLDGSVLLVPTPSNNATEMTSAVDLSLVGFDTIGDIKAHLEAACPKTVSCADIVVATAAQSLVASSGPQINFQYGRRDGVTSYASLAQQTLPDPKSSFKTILAQFGAQGFSPQDTVALSGAHTFGQAHCSSFSNRLYPTVDPTLKPSYADYLKRQCPTSTADVQVDQDPTTPDTFDNKYYSNLQNNEGLFNTDEEQEYYPQNGVRKLVGVYARSQGKWFADFEEAMLRMSRLGVLTGSQGQIRVNCSYVNP